MEYIRTFTRELDVGERAVLDIENRSGSITVSGGDRDQVRIEVAARLWAENDEDADDQLALITRGIKHDGERVTVRAPSLLRPGGLLAIFGRGPRIDYQVTTPKATRGRITNRSGRIEIEELEGPFELESRSGRVAVSRIGSDTTIVSRSGGVQVESLRGSLSIDSRSGTVKVQRCAGDVDVRARSGSIQVEEVGGNLKLDCRSGSVTLLDIGGSVTAHTVSGSFRYSGAVRGPFDVKVVSGSVHLAVDPDSRFYLDAETLSGTVQSDLSLRRDHDGDGAPERGPKVYIRAQSGSIRIVPR